MESSQGVDSLDAFFAGRPEARALYERVADASRELDSVEVRVGRSQVALWRAHPFAAVWVPGQYLAGATAPLVLTVYLRHRADSPRWKEIVEPRPGRFTHHLELHRVGDVDAEVAAWLREAWDAAK